MYRILKKVNLRPTLMLLEIEAPRVARRARPGQFIILRVNADGERIPITIHDVNHVTGGVSIIVQVVGATTYKLNRLREGDFIQGVEGATATILEDGGQVEVVQEGVLLDARLEADAGAGGRTHQAEGLDEDFPVGLHIGREGIDEEVGNCHFVEFLKVSLS